MNTIHKTRQLNRMAMTPPGYLSTKDYAEKYGLKWRHVYDLANACIIPSMKIGTYKVVADMPPPEKTGRVYKKRKAAK